MEYKCKRKHLKVTALRALKSQNLCIFVPPPFQIYQTSKKDPPKKKFEWLKNTWRPVKPVTIITSSILSTSNQIDICTKNTKIVIHLKSNAWLVFVFEINCCLCIVFQRIIKKLIKMKNKLNLVCYIFWNSLKDLIDALIYFNLTGKFLSQKFYA